MKEKWSKDVYLVLACVGAAAGLGNIWRFPYMAYENGGSAFLIPYIICIILIGLPLILLELGVGTWAQGSIVASAEKANPKMRWLGWWVLINSLVIVFYYAVVLAWCVLYTMFSFSSAWGDDPAGFFFGKVLALTDNPFSFGSIQLKTIGALAFVWALIYWIVSKDIKRISRVLVITVPVPIILLIIMSANMATLDGSGDGIQLYLKPDLSRLLTVGVWGAAASQVLLSLGLGMGQIVAYASRKKDRSQLAKVGFSICTFDTLISFIAGLTVFGAMGYLAYASQTSIDELALESLPLSFISYPLALSQMPLGSLWGVIFFVMLVLLGIDSAFAVVEANFSALEEKFEAKSRRSIIGLLCSLCFIGGIFFTFGGGLYWLDIIDHWVANYSIAAIAYLQLILFSSHRYFDDIWKPFSGIIKPAIAKKLLRYAIPVFLVAVFGSGLIKDFTVPYSDYPWMAILIGGWGVTLLALILSFIISRRQYR